MPPVLDLHNRLHTTDFIQAYLGYLPETDRKKIQLKLEKIEAEGASPEHLAEIALHIGRKTWAARQALAKYLATQNGCDEEWRRVVAAVSAGTAHLLERFRHGTKCESLDAVLTHDESASAFRNLEHLEIEQVRTQIREVIWRTMRKNLSAKAKEAEGTLEDIVSRLDALRALADGTPEVQDELLSKLARWENDLYFGGTILDVKELDEEIRYYREAAANPIEP